MSYSCNSEIALSAANDADDIGSWLNDDMLPLSSMGLVSTGMI